MVGTEGAQFIAETFGRPSTIARLKTRLRRLFTTRFAINRMRNLLILVYKQPFTDRITIDPLDFEDTWSKQMMIDHFEERVKTLPDAIILDLYEDYLKAEAMNTRKGKETVTNCILYFLEQSYALDNWFDKEKMVARNRKKKF